MTDDIRQTPEYANYLKLLGWETIKIKNGESRLTRQVFIKKFLLIGSIIKVQRIPLPIPLKEIEKIAKDNRAFQILIDQEFNSRKVIRTKHIEEWQEYGYKINQASYFPTKTIWIDLKRSDKEIFDSFSEAKRRAVRKAEKNGLTVKESTSQKEFLWLKKKSLVEKFIIPFRTAEEINALYQAFYPKNAKILIAYQKEKPVAGIFLLHADKTAYYWLAAATNLGKKLFAPTLLVWEALKMAKKMGCQIFDFEGIYDERFPIKTWLGFTKFKQGFGGKEILYPPSFIKIIFPSLIKVSKIEKVV